LAVGFGAGYFGGPLEIPKLHSDSVLHSPEFLFDGALGYGVVPGVALAANAELGIGPSPARDTEAGGIIETIYLAKLGLLADVYPLERTHFLLGAGFTHAGFNVAQDDDPEGGVSGESMTGPHFDAGIGYRAGRRFDVSARLDYALLSDAHDDRFQPIGLAIFLSWIRF